MEFFPENILHKKMSLNFFFFWFTNFQGFQGPMGNITLHYYITLYNILPKTSSNAVFWSEKCVLCEASFPFHCVCMRV